VRCVRRVTQIISGQRTSSGEQSKAEKAVWRSVGEHHEFQRALFGADITRPFQLLANALEDERALPHSVSQLLHFTWLRVKVWCADACAATCRGDSLTRAAVLVSRVSDRVLAS
jgi:hypothetical protein